MWIRLFLAILFLTSVGGAQTVSTKGDSLDKVQVLSLLLGDVQNSRVASLVVERGITFEPTDRYLQLLKKVGADEGVITAVRVALRPEASSKGENASPRSAALDRDQILDLLQTGVDNDALAKLVASRGIDFEPFDEYLHAYEVAGAQDSLLSALRQAGRNSKPAATSNTMVAPKGEGGNPAAGNKTYKHVRVPGEKEAARIVFQPLPEYPPLAMRARVQGVIRLEALIGPDGSVEELKVISGHPLLIQSAMDAVSKWRYQPLQVKGEPVEVETEIDVNYVLKP